MKIKFKVRKSKYEIVTDMLKYLVLKRQVEEIDAGIEKLALASFSFPCKPIAEKILLMSFSKEKKLSEMAIIRHYLKQIDRESLKRLTGYYILGKQFKTFNRSFFRMMTKVDNYYRWLKKYEMVK